jgi:hypothetical protein
MDDRAVACGNEVDHLAHRGGLLVTGDDKDTRGDLARVAGLVEEGPDAAGLVLVVEIGSDIYLRIGVEMAAELVAKASPLVQGAVLALPTGDAAALDVLLGALP